MPTNVPLICPECKVEMNHHANKLVFGAESSANKGPSEGTLAEFHSCPQCGRGAVRGL